MFLASRISRGAALWAISISTAMALAPALWAAQNGSPSKENSMEPWSRAQVLQPEDLVRELGGEKSGSAPTIVYVGFRTLFEGGHIPGATFHGTASKEEGLAELKKWAASLSRNTHLVIYCGCCPFDHCPNIHPAYKALHELGFSHLRVLALPTSFAADWVEKGYPIQKGL